MILLLPYQLQLSFPHLHHKRTLNFITAAAQELYAKGQLRVKPYADYLKQKHKKVHSTESNFKFVKSTYTMHIYHTYSCPSVSDYLDTSSELAINFLTKIHHHLTLSFRVANDNGFQFHGYLVGRCHINGNISIVMCLYYPPTCCIVERDLDIGPSLNLDEQLITNLMSMMHLCCLEQPCHHYCCDLP